MSANEQLCAEGCIRTRSGAEVSLFEPRPETINFDDIAISLSRLSRYNGHASVFCSVAAHSILVADLLPTELRLAGLLHDAAEAYLGDIARPLKRALWAAWAKPATDTYGSWLDMEPINDVERRIQDAIAVAAGIDGDDLRHPDVKAADNMAMAVEVEWFLGVSAAELGLPEPTVDARIEFSYRRSYYGMAGNPMAGFWSDEIEAYVKKK
jgi:hypothetical protein